MASRTTGGATTYFTYDGKSRLASVRVGADTTFYWYNANGELTVRARNNNSGTNVRTIERLFFWDGGQLVAETDAGMTTRYGEYAYLPGTDRPLALITTDSSVSGNTLVRYYQQDELGNVIGLTSGSTVVQQITYEPWGAVASITGGALADTSRLRWKGLLWEGGATQLYYVRNRWYDPAARRFVSQDPIGVHGGINQYVFGSNDPVNHGDPLGLNPCPETALQQGWHTVTIDGKEWCYNGGQPLPPVSITASQAQSGFSDNFGNRGGPFLYAPISNSSAGGGGSGTGGGTAAEGLQVLGACVADDLGLNAILGLGGITATVWGAPTMAKHIRAGAASERTSLAATVARDVFYGRRLPLGMKLPAPSFGAVRTLTVTSSKVGKVVGRAVPVVGWGLLAYDAYRIGSCVAKRT